MAMGFVSLVLQLTVLRELLTVFSGNELDIGITLSLWLVFVGLGSYSGTRFGFEGKKAFGASFIAAALLAEPTVAAVWFILPLLGLGPGEAASLGGTFAATALALFPLCFCLGLQFPVAVSCRRGDAPASSVYGLEAAGAFAGALVFTFLFSGRASAAALSAALGALYMAAAALVFGRRSALALLILPLLIHLAAEGMRPSPVEAGKLLERAQSRYGEIWVTALGGQSNVYGSGQFLYSYPNSQAEELAVHLPMAVKPGARRVLVLGGSPAVLREYLKYPARRVDFVEIDPVLLETSVSILDESDRRAVESTRTSLVIEDGRRYIKSVKSPAYDVIVINLPAPSTANLNRFYTVEFFREARAALAEGGVLAVKVPSSGGYVGRRMQMASGSIYNSLRKVFGHVGATTEEYGWLFASDAPIELNPESLAYSFRQSGIRTRHFHPYIIEDAFAPLRAGLFAKRLGEAGEINTDLRPSAYLFNLMLWAEIHGGLLLNAALSFGGMRISILALGLFVAVALAVIGKKTRTLYYSMFTGGFAGISLVLAIALAYQAAYGYVYEMIGLLAALFMAGVAAGSFASRGGGKRSLMALEALTAAFALAVPLLFRAEALYYVLTFAAGAITGYQFALVNRMAGREGSFAGRLYAADLGGSFLGAVLSAIILVPMTGMQGALWFLAGVKAVSLAAVSFIRE